MPHQVICPIRPLNGEQLLVCQDEDFDETVADFSDPEAVTLTQTDEYGVTHTIILSAQIITKMHPLMSLWKTQNILDPRLT